MSRPRVERLKAAGLCSKCGKVSPAPERQFCEACLEKFRADRRRRYKENPEPFKQARREQTAERKLRGLCISCGEPLDDKRYAKCAACRYINNMYQKKPMTEQQIEASRESNRARYLRLKQMGLCVRCGYRPAIEGKTMCAYCEARRNNGSEQRRRAAGEMPADMRWDGHRCGQCLSTEVLPGKKLCAKCYEMKLRCIKRAMAARQERKDKDVLHPFLQPEQGHDRQEARV